MSTNLFKAAPIEPHGYLPWPWDWVARAAEFLTSHDPSRVPSFSSDADETTALTIVAGAAPAIIIGYAAISPSAISAYFSLFRLLRTYGKGWNFAGIIVISISLLSISLFGFLFPALAFNMALRGIQTHVKAYYSLALEIEVESLFALFFLFFTYIGGSWASDLLSQEGGEDSQPPEDSGIAGSGEGSSRLMNRDETVNSKPEVSSAAPRLDASIEASGNDAVQQAQHGEPAPNVLPAPSLPANIDSGGGGGDDDAV